MTAKPIRVLIIEDHNVVREGLAALLKVADGLDVVGEAADGVEAIAQFRKHQPDIALIDLRLPRLSGVDVIERIRMETPHARFIVLTTYDGDEDIYRALKAGARAYLLKDSAEADLLAAVRALTDGKSFFSPAISKILVEDYMRQLESRGAEDTYELLTNREREILQLLAEGRTNKEVANMLNLSLYTVETHRAHILQKLNLHSVPELILYAVRKGIIA